MKQVCDWAGVPRAIINISSNAVAFFTYIQYGQSLRQAFYIIICSILWEEISNYLIHIISFAELNISMQKCIG
jgi:hypothetical protein